MKSLALGLYAFSISVAALFLAGCGGSQPTGAPGAMPQSPATTTQAAHGTSMNGSPDSRHRGSGTGARSWVNPYASNQDFIYTSAYSGPSGIIYLYSYPQGKKVAEITDLQLPTGECADSAGNVFVVALSSGSQSSTIYEYAHGGTTPIATLSDPGIGSGCSVDSTSGNLAVSNGADYSNPYYHNKGDVAVFIGAEGSPKMYYTAAFNSFGFCGYDGGGNLYLAFAIPSALEFGLARLARGGTSIQQVFVSAPIYANSRFSPSVQWDGKYITISSLRGAFSNSHEVLVYRLSISGQNAKVVSETKLRGKRRNGLVGQIWISGSAALSNAEGPDYGNVSAWRYPRGGRPALTITKVIDLSKYGPWGITLSRAPGS